MPIIILLFMLHCGLTLEESFKASTYNAAKAINRESTKGLIKKGYDADLLFWDINNYNEIPYWHGSSRIKSIIKNGKILDI